MLTESLYIPVEDNPRSVKCAKPLVLLKAIDGVAAVKSPSGCHFDKSCLLIVAVKSKF